MPARMTWTVGASSIALAVGTSFWPARTNSSSAKISRSLASAWLMAEALRPEPLGGAGDAGIDEQSVERHQQIGVDFP